MAAAPYPLRDIQNTLAIELTIRGSIRTALRPIRRAFIVGIGVRILFLACTRSADPCTAFPAESSFFSAGVLEHGLERCCRGNEMI
jgi:hypothetical protein